MTDDPDFDDQPVQLLRRVGKGKLLATMQSLFERHAPARMATIHAAIAAGDPAAAALPAHSLKSSAGQLGAIGLQRVCDEIEKAAGRGDLPALAQLAARAEPLMQRALEWTRCSANEEKVL